MSDQSTSQNSIISQEPTSSGSNQAQNQTQNSQAQSSNQQQAPSFSWPDNWQEHLSDDIKNEGIWKNIKTIPDALKSLVHANKLVGADKIAKPSKYWKDEEKAAWYQQNLGVPENPDKYEIPEDAKAFDETSMKDFKAVAHKMNLAPDQVKGILSWYKGVADKSKEQLVNDIEKDRVQSIEKLKSEWKDDYEAKLADTQKLFSLTADEETRQWVNDSGVGNDPRFIKWVNKLTPLLKEDTLKDGTARGFAGKSEIQNKIKEIRNDAKHPANDRWHPDHDNGVAELRELYKKLHSS